MSKPMISMMSNILIWVVVSLYFHFSTYAAPFAIVNDSTLHLQSHGCTSGVNVLDIFKLKQHIEGQQLLESDHQLLAADINDDHIINRKDLEELTSVFLGDQPRFSSQGCWKHIYDMNTIGIDGNATAQIKHRAIKVGDIDGSLSKTKSKESVKNVKPQITQLLTPDQVFDAGDQVTIPIQLLPERIVKGLQINFSFDGTALRFDQISEGILPIEQLQYVLHNQQQNSELSTAFISNEDITISHRQPLFTLTFTAMRSGRLSDVFTEHSGRFQALLFDDNEYMNYLQFDFTADALMPLQVGNNFPNPFVDQSSVQLNVGYNMPLELSILDENGRSIYRDFSEYTAGVHTIHINSRMLDNHFGVFFIHISGGEVREIRKLIRIR